MTPDIFPQCSAVSAGCVNKSQGSLHISAKSDTAYKLSAVFTLGMILMLILTSYSEYGHGNDGNLKYLPLPFREGSENLLIDI